MNKVLQKNFILHLPEIMKNAENAIMNYDSNDFLSFGKTLGTLVVLLLKEPPKEQCDALGFLGF